LDRRVKTRPTFHGSPGARRNPKPRPGGFYGWTDCPGYAKRLKQILVLLNDAITINDMNAPELRLHPLKGFWAVTVQANWRVIFEFEDGNAYVVDYLDYH